MATKKLLIRKPSRAIQTAKRAGIEIDVPKPHLPVTEQEQADIM